MAEPLKRSREAFCAIAEYLQAIRIAEIRQTLEFLGVQHVEVILALLFFIMLQFTKFTAVLMLACMIAYGIFYMWDTWFPEVKEGLSGAPQNADYDRLYGTPYWSSYGPSYSPSNVGGSGFSSGTISNYDYTYPNTFPPDNRDERTSALFPPYTYSEIGGDHMFDSQEKNIRGRNFVGASPISVSNHVTQPQDPANQRRSIPTGNNTPQRRPLVNPQDDNRYFNRDPLAFRRLIANDYRLYRPTTSTDAHHYHSYAAPVPEERSRRLPGLFDEYLLKNRRNNDKRSSRERKYFGSEQSERLKSGSREVLHRSRNTPGGMLVRSSGAHGRSNAGNYNNLENTKRKGRK